MNIIIKQKIFHKKKIDMIDNIIEKDYLTIFFDVETDTVQYVDKNDEGYFPIELEDKKQSDSEIIQECINWINTNNILSIYKPTYNTQYDLILERKKQEISNRQAVE